MAIGDTYLTNKNGTLTLDHGSESSAWTGTRRRFVLSAAGIAAATTLTRTAEAQGTPGVATPTTATDIPSTPVGDQLQWILLTLDEIAAGNDPSETEIEARFDPTFLAALSPADIISVFGQLAELLAPVTFLGFASEPTLTTALGLLEANDGSQWLIELAVTENAPHQIVGLFFRPIDLDDREPLDDWEEFDEEINALAPRVSFLAAEITPDGSLPVHALNSSDRLAIGSAFKLWVLGELARQVQAGTADWDEMLPVDDRLKSLPSGQLQDAEAGTELTLEEHARLMISISDNTATDHLMARLGRENVEAAQADLGHGDPSVNIPMLTTLELFKLKITAEPELVSRFLAASVDERRAMLETEVAALPTPTLADAITWLVPRDIETLEWFASAEDLVNTMQALALLATEPETRIVLDILSINPGMPFAQEDVPYVGFKGGSEPGVMNLTWLIERTDGRTFAVSGSLNNPVASLDEAAMAVLLARAVDLLIATA